MAGRKILVLTNRVPYPLRDGGNLAMNTMIEGYRKAGWQVYLLSMNTSRHRVAGDTLSKIYSNLYAFETVDVDNDLNWKAILKNFLFEREAEHVKRYYSDDFRKRLKDVLVAFEPDVVQVESVFLTTYMPVIRKYANAVTVLRLHNVEYQIWQGLASKTKNILKRIYLDSLAERIRNYERKAWGQYDILLAITEKDAHLVQRLETVNEILVAPFSIDITSVPAQNSGEWVGYHIGAMDWRPNEDAVRWFVHKAWPVVRKAAPGFRFYFAGRNMSAEMKEIQVDGVFSMGEVEDANAFIADKRILIVPLWSGGGIRVKILEAMAAGKIVITTSKGIKGIEAQPNEHYLRAHSPQDFAKAIKWCLEHKSEAENIAANARALVVEKYNQAKVADTIATEVEKLLSARRG